MMIIKFLYLFFGRYFDCVSDWYFFNDGYVDFFFYIFNDDFGNFFNFGSVYVFNDGYYISNFVFFGDNFVEK